MEIIYGFMAAAILAGLLSLAYATGQWTQAADLKRQCELQKSIRLQTGSAEHFFYCDRTPVATPSR